MKNVKALVLLYIFSPPNASFIAWFCLVQFFVLLGRHVNWYLIESLVLYTRNLRFSYSILQLKEFLLDQPEAYEIKLGDQLFRRPGDPPFEEAFEKLQSEKSKVDHTSSKKKDRHNEL